MKTEIQETSQEALSDINQNGYKLRTTILCYEAIRKLGVCSNKQIQRETRLGINQVSGRVFDLRNKYKVVGLAKKDLCPISKGRLVCMWKVVKDWDKVKNRESNIFNSVVGKCYKCGCLICECEVLE